MNCTATFKTKLCHSCVLRNLSCNQFIEVKANTKILQHRKNFFTSEYNFQKVKTDFPSYIEEIISSKPFLLKHWSKHMTKIY